MNNPGPQWIDLSRKVGKGIEIIKKKENVEYWARKGVVIWIWSKKNRFWQWKLKNDAKKKKKLTKFDLNFINWCCFGMREVIVIKNWEMKWVSDYATGRAEMVWTFLKNFKKTGWIDNIDVGIVREEYISNNKPGNCVWGEYYRKETMTRFGKKLNFLLEMDHSGVLVV
jgi:hypothetical protein